MLAHDHMAAKTGNVDGIWWTEHDWRLANFAKIESVSFESAPEVQQFPARVAESDRPPAEIELTWEPVESTAESACSAAVTDERSATGAASLRVSAAASGGPVTGRWELTVDNHRATYPLFSEPRVDLSVYPEDGLLEDGGLLLEFVLSQQPPDLTHPRIQYVAGDGPVEESEARTVTRRLEVEPGRWNDLSVEPAADAADLDLPADGLDNSLHRLRVGVTSEGPERAACFDDLEVRPGREGPELLELQRDLLEGLPTEVEHFVGMEVSWYGQHVNAYGEDVPIPDYEERDPEELGTSGIVEHVHEHGGVACFNHPSPDNRGAFADRLVVEEAYGAELTEVLRRDGEPVDRLELWDRVSAAGLVLTGLGSGDTHHADTGWEAGERAPYYVTHVWADALTTEALLDALTAGRAYIGSPAWFRGTLDIEGPGGLAMGGAAVRSDACSLIATVTGASAGDRLVWLCNGERIGTETLADADAEASVDVPAGEEVRAVRVELRREDVAPNPIAASNPVYLTSERDALSAQAAGRFVDE
jgi:hypothetical protein